VILSKEGQEVARASLDVPHGFYGATGIHDVTGDGSPEIVLLAGVGAKTSQASIYMYKEGHLVKIFEWSGWRFEIVRLRGRPVLALTPLEYGSLTELKVWRDGKFQQANELFPEYYGPEIDQQKRILDAPQGLPVYVIVDACKLGARGLVYGKNYEDAKQLCLKALEVARSAPGLIASQIGAGPEVLAREREQAGDEIRAMLDRLAEAQKKEMPHVPD